MIELNGVRDALAMLTTTAPRFYRAPGRLNLIGDHVDYSQGFVLPIAIDRATVVAAAHRDDRVVRMRAHDRDEIAEFSLDDRDPAPRGSWFDDVRRIALAIETQGTSLRGADLAYRTTIPSDAVLGLTASVGVGSALALLGAADTQIPESEIVNICWEIEGHVGPVTVALGKRDHALLVDCRTAEATTVPLALPDVAIIVCISHVPPTTRQLERERHVECDEAVTILRRHLPKIKTLRDVSLADFLRVGEKLPSVLRRRTRHIVTENVRVLQTVAALRAQDPVAIGGRMNESHDSLRDDYDISSPEIDVLVSAARSVVGVFGSRITGPGRGGATVNLVRRDQVLAFRSTIASVYRATFSRDATIFEVRAADGAAFIG